MNVYVCEALTANLGLGAISSLVYSYYYYYYICKALRANPRLGAILSLRYYYYYYYLIWHQRQKYDWLQIFMTGCRYL